MSQADASRAAGAGQTPPDGPRPASGGFLPVDPVLLEPGPQREFDLYQRTVTEMVLFCASRYRLSSQALAHVREQKDATLYVPLEQSTAVSQWAQRVLDRVIRQRDLAPKRRGEILYGSAKAIMADVLANPDAPDLLRRSSSLANTTVAFMLETPGAIKSMASLFTKDYYTFSHSVQVAVLGAALYKSLVTSKAEPLRRFGLGALLHDIGKAAIETRILNKPGKLEADEFRQIQTHPSFGWQILTRHGITDPLIEQVVCHHHEKLDGTGYPFGLRGEEISPAARVAGIVDIYNALTTDRPYRAAMPVPTALGLMESSMMGSHLDPEYFTAFRRLVRTLPPPGQGT